MSRLREAFDQLQSTRVSLRELSGEAFDIAFDMTSVDSFLAGIATRLIDRRPIIAAEWRQQLEPPLLHGNAWSLKGTLFSLDSHPDLLAFARRLEALRRACVAVLNGSECS